MATLSCRCKQVQITIPDKPLNRLECCCTDCVKGVAWCASNASQPLPVFNDAVYFANAVHIVDDSMLDKMACYLIKKGYNTHRVVATCCWTCLLGDHPSYQGKRFISFSNSATLLLNDDSAPLLPASRRIFESDLDPEVRTSLADFVTPPKESLPTEEEKDKAIMHAQELVANSEGEYITVQNLMAKLGEVQFMDPDFDGPEPMWNKQTKTAGST